MSIHFDVKRKITVDGKDYERLEDVPPEARTAILKAMSASQSGASKVETKTTINVNGKTYSSVEDLPAPLRLAVGGLTSWALKNASGENAGNPGEAVRPQPAVSLKKLLIAAAVASFLYWLVRLLR